MIKNWRLYLIEAWALGMFMLAAALVMILVDHPAFPVHNAIPSPLFRRAIVGVAMGLTAVGLIYSRWGKLSGGAYEPGRNAGAVATQSHYHR